MITGMFIYLLTIILSSISLLLPTWTIYPADFLDGLTYFFSSFAKLNFLFPVDSLFTVMIFIINFEILYFTAKIITKIFNFFRGTGSGIDI